MTGQDIQHNAVDLLERVRDADDAREDLPQHFVALFLHLRRYAAMAALRASGAAAAECSALFRGFRVPPLNILL